MRSGRGAGEERSEGMEGWRGGEVERWKGGEEKR
jgi:hypothetical protein